MNLVIISAIKWVSMQMAILLLDTAAFTLAPYMFLKKLPACGTKLPNYKTLYHVIGGEAIGRLILKMTQSLW